MTSARRSSAERLRRVGHAVEHRAHQLRASWPRRTFAAQVAIPLLAFALIAYAGFSEQGNVDPIIAIFALPFVYVGFTQRPGASFAIAPLAAIAVLIGTRFVVGPVLMGMLFFALPMAVLTGEAVAQAVRRRERAEHRMERLLHAVRVLARTSDERDGAELVAALAAELLEADAVAVLLSDRPPSRRYLNRAWFGHPALADAAPLIVDAGGDATLRSGSIRFFPDATHADLLLGVSRSIRAAAIVPLPGDHSPIGLVVALWGRPRRALPPGAAQAAELLSQEAGRMFQRLATTAALTRDAHTDPLTELANRRTFARALATLQPGDAVVLVDLDHFKSVNDTFGHDVGDDTLRILASCLRRASRQVDTVARYGGEEFALLLADADVDGARVVLRRLRRAWDAEGPVTTFSAGVAIHEEGRDPKDSLRRADAALYQAKADGRNRDVFSPTHAPTQPITR